MQINSSITQHYMYVLQVSQVKVAVHMYSNCALPDSLNVPSNRGFRFCVDLDVVWRWLGSNAAVDVYIPCATVLPQHDSNMYTLCFCSDAEVKGLCGIYQRIIMVPRPDYASRVGKSTLFRM